MAPPIPTATSAPASRWSTGSETGSDIISQHNSAPDLSKFQYHYARDGDCSLKSLVALVSEDLLSHEVLHDWDDFLSPDLVKSLANFVKSQLVRKKVDRGDYMVNFHRIQEVSTNNGRNVINHTLRSGNDVTAHLFPCFDCKNAEIPPNSGKFSRDLVSQGRIIDIKEHVDSLSRSTLFLLHAFSIRLLGEDFTFIRNFASRHLLAEPLFKEPYPFQDIATSEYQGICYKRLTFSFHLSHLLLQADTSDDPKKHGPDRQYLGSFAPLPDRGFGETTSQQCLFKSSSSVLLTLVVPETQPSRHEEHCLLGNPQARWTVLTVNGSWRMATVSTREPLDYQSPIAQFVRGICGTVASQRVNATPIIHALKEKLFETENDSLFDDEEFTKSRVYHWAIKKCRQLSDSIQVSMRFLRDVQANKLPGLVSAAHRYENPGLDFWTTRLRDEIHGLAGLLNEIDSLKEHAVESREALHGASGLLATRMSLAQNNSLKALTYLSVACLPLGTVSSVFGIEVLPGGATFTSFLVVLGTFTAANILLALHLHNMVISRTHRQHSGTKPTKPAKITLDQVINAAVQAASNVASIFLSLWNSAKGHVETLVHDARIHSPNRAVFPFFVIAIGIYRVSRFAILAACFLVFEFSWKELEYDLFLLRRPVKSVLFPIQFSYWKLAADLVRFVSIPIWLSFALISAVCVALASIVKCAFQCIRCFTCSL